MAIAGARSAVAVPILLLLGWPKRWLNPVQWGAAGFYVGTVVLFVLSNRMTTAANAIFLQYTAPIYVALLSKWWLRERAARADMALTVVALGGIALFFMDELSSEGFAGNLVALGSGVCFAGMILCLRKDRDGEPWAPILVGNILTALICLPWMCGGLPSSKTLVTLLIMGVFQLALPYVLYSIAIRRVTAMEATLLPLIEPVLNPVWVMMANGERPGPWALGGAALVMLAVLTRGVLMIVARKSEDHSSAAPPNAADDA